MGDTTLCNTLSIKLLMKQKILQLNATYRKKLEIVLKSSQVGKAIIKDIALGLRRGVMVLLLNKSHMFHASHSLPSHLNIK